MPGSCLSKHGPFLCPPVYTVRMDLRITIRQLRAELADVLHRVGVHREAFLITRNGKDIARVVPLDLPDAPPPSSMATP